MTTKPQRNRLIVIADIVAGIVFGLIGALYMLWSLTFSFRAPHEVFGAPFKIFTVLAWVIGVAAFILFATRKRLAFYWPIVGIILMFLVGLIITSIAAA